MEQKEFDAKITLIDYTHRAKEQLIFTKNTRLNMSASSFVDVVNMTEEDKLQELEYMSRTIPSSWEFVSYTFMVEKVTRAFTHQAVRTRPNSYAQQTMRILDMDGFTYHCSKNLDEKSAALYHETMKTIQANYDKMIDLGTAIEDARGILPTNIHTNICIRMNLRTLAEMASSRTGTRTQDEYRFVLNQMIDTVLATHPWASKFLFPKGRDKFDSLEKLINQTPDCDLKTNCKKDLDILRKDLAK